MLIDYVGGREAFAYVSNHADYAEVLNFYEPEDFRGKIVILGESSLISKDVANTPFEAIFRKKPPPEIWRWLFCFTGPAPRDCARFAWRHTSLRRRDAKAN